MSVCHSDVMVTVGNGHYDYASHTFHPKSLSNHVIGGGGGGGGDGGGGGGEEVEAEEETVEVAAARYVILVFFPQGIVIVSSFPILIKLTSRAFVSYYWNIK